MQAEHETNRCLCLGLLQKRGYDSARRVYSTDALCPTLVTFAGGTEIKVSYKQRIRKLTPLECWRLMGFDDEDFEKAAKVCSNNQLYKQAGNSIVVDVLEAILEELLIPDENRSRQLRLTDL